MRKCTDAGRRCGIDRRPWRSGVVAAVVLLLLASPPASTQTPQGASLTGQVSSEDGTPIIDVGLSLTEVGGRDPRATVLSGASGIYRFTGLPAGSYVLRAQRLGYVTEEREVGLVAGRTVSADLVLRTDTIAIEGIVVEGLRGSDRERMRFESEPGVTARVVEAATLKSLPGLAEPDILRAVQLLPGVISTSDFSSSYNVRGGSADQNLILIDGFTVFNPFHLGGLFSVFNSDAVEQAELFAGGFGAEFGGRVSSVLNIESRADVPERVEVRGGISMLASRALVNAPIRGRLGDLLGGDGGNLILSARRSYFDQVLRPVANFPYHLADLQAHAGLQTAGGGRLSFTGYLGQDVLDLSNFGAGDSDDAADVLRLKWNWGNQVIGARLIQPTRAGWVLDSRLGFSRFAERLGFVDFGDVRFESRVDQLLGRLDLSRDFSEAISFRTGFAVERLEHQNLAQGGGTTFYDVDGDGLLGAIYGSARWNPGPAWIIEPGLRVDVWNSAGATRTVVSPRFAAKRFIDASRNVAVKVAVGRYSQFLHSLRDEELPVSNDTWVLAGPGVPAVVSDQVQLGIESFWGLGWSASAEIYARSFDGVTEINAAEDPNDALDDLLVGEGSSHGLDLQIRRSEGNLTGWIAASWLRAERTFPDPLAAGWDDLPQTVSFPPIYDRRINLDFVAQFEARGYEFGARWNYGSGLPYTRPTAQHLSWRHNPIFGRLEPELGDEEAEEEEEAGGPPVGVIVGARNSERYPAYHRLDVSIRRPFERGWGTFVPYLQVLNVYNQRNVLFYFYNYDRTPPVRSGFSMFPLLPSIGVEVAF